MHHLEGDAVTCFDSVAAQIDPEENVLVIEDSTHAFDNTLAVLRNYSTLIKLGGYFIVEGSICHHGLDVGQSLGLYEAIDAFIQNNAELLV